MAAARSFLNLIAGTEMLSLLKPNPFIIQSGDDVREWKSDLETCRVRVCVFPLWLPKSEGLAGGHVQCAPYVLRGATKHASCKRSTQTDTRGAGEI